MALINFLSSKLVSMIRYLVTTLKVVPRGTEGAVSVEGTIAGLLASTFLALVGFLMGEVLSSVCSHSLTVTFFCFLIFFLFEYLFILQIMFYSLMS